MARGKQGADWTLIGFAVVLVLMGVGGLLYFLTMPAEGLPDQGAGIGDEEEGGVYDIIEGVPVIGPIISETADVVVNDVLDPMFEWLGF